MVHTEPNPHAQPLGQPTVWHTAGLVVGLVVVANASSLFIFINYVAFISAFPRPMQGENILMPWSVCLVGYLALPTLLPWLLSRPFLVQRGRRVCFLLILLATVLVWHEVFGMSDLLDKAYRRGL